MSGIPGKLKKPIYNMAIMNLENIQKEAQSYLRYGATYIPDIHTLDSLSVILARYKRKVPNPLRGENNFYIQQQLVGRCEDFY